MIYVTYTWSFNANMLKLAIGYRNIFPIPLKCFYLNNCFFKLMCTERRTLKQYSKIDWLFINNKLENLVQHLFTKL